MSARKTSPSYRFTKEHEKSSTCNNIVAIHWKLLGYFFGRLLALALECLRISIINVIAYLLLRLINVIVKNIRWVRFFKGEVGVQ